jgi:hypothetical protein
MIKFRYMVPGTLMLFVAVLIWQFRSTEHESSEMPTNQNTAKREQARPTPTVRVPNIATRTTASDFLSPWWTRFSAEQAAKYSVSLVKKNKSHELYQVYYLDRPVELLTIRRDLASEQHITPLTPFEALDESDVISELDVKDKLLAKDSSISELKLTQKVWAMGPNQTLYPAYKFSVKKRGAETTQEWITNAKTGEITSINTFSRN